MLKKVCCENKLSITTLIVIVPLLLVMAMPKPALSEDFLSIYRIGPEDVLRIYVWNQPEFSLTVPVRIDGKISIPLVNDVDAAGLTPTELQKKITKKLSAFIENPTVSIIIEQINSQKIVVVGRVNAPGVYKVGSLITLIEAISKAGSIGEWANAKRVKVVRKKNGKEEIIEINYESIIEGKNLENNIIIYPGDTIIVP